MCVCLFVYLHHHVNGWKFIIKIAWSGLSALILWLISFFVEPSFVLHQIRFSPCVSIVYFKFPLYIFHIQCELHRLFSFLFIAVELLYKPKEENANKFCIYMLRRSEEMWGIQKKDLEWVMRIIYSGPFTGRRWWCRRIKWMIYMKIASS